MRQFRPSRSESRVLRSLSEQTVNDEEDNRAHGGDKYAPEVKRFDLPETDEAAKKTADDPPCDADQDRDKDAAGIFPGHDEFSESPGNEAQKDPGENAHSLF